MENSSSLSTYSCNLNSYLDNLPDLVYYHLFKYLDLIDVFELRLINKRFYCIIRDYNIIELSFLDFDSYVSFKSSGVKDNWFSTTRSIKFRNQFDISKLPLLIEPAHNLLNLKYLRIADCETTRKFVKPKDLNKFTKLQILIIGRMNLSSNNNNNNNNNLHLPDLKALSIKLNKGFDVFCDLLVDAPKLQSLHMHNQDDNPFNVVNDQLKFKYPLSIKYIKLGLCIEESILIFGNLECLELDDIMDLNLDDLTKLTNLKKIRIITNDPSAQDKLKSLFRLKKHDTELILQGVKLNSIEKIDEYYAHNDELKFQLDNYNELDDLNFVKELSYCQLTRLLSNNQSSALFNKYVNIQVLVLGKKEKDENRLIDVIKGCPKLNYLKMIMSPLKQQFFNRLPTICSLFELDIIEADTDLNFGFMAQMPYLINLNTDQDVLRSENLNLNDLRYLRTFHFKITENIYVSVRRKASKDRYKIIRFVYMHETDSITNLLTCVVSYFRDKDDVQIDDQLYYELPRRKVFTLGELTEVLSRVRDDYQ